MTITIEQHEKLDQIEHILRERASEPEPPYWFMFDYDSKLPLEIDAGETFCKECIMEIVPDAEYGQQYDGGFSCETDGCEHCEKCGKLLEYTLTDYGVDQELEHFSEYPLENLNDADECYHLARIANGLYTDEQKEKFLKLIELIPEAPGAPQAPTPRA